MVRQGLWLLVMALVVGFAPSIQQTSPPAIDLSVTAGYNGLFRENQWFPLLVEVVNNGGDVTGRVVVRPDRSGNAFANTFSAPVEMPAGSRKSVFLYVSARSFATEVRVEFIDAQGLPLAEQAVPLRNVFFQDQLHVVLTQATAGSVDLTGVRSGGYTAHQANWLIENIPDQASALDAIDMMVISDIDTGPMSSAQRQAVADWVADGGHLVVTGGANWQATAAALEDLLPLQPDASSTVDNLDGLAALGSTGELRGETIAATGTLIDQAQTLAATEDGLPLLARRAWGLGTVDYLAVDPLAQPMRDWDGRSELWFTLAASVEPLPAWSHDLFDTDRATNAVEIMPGLDLLPDVLPLCGFLAAYVALIGPLNYVILNRINRREWAWLTIPVFIGIFSVLAWVVGFNLRGNTATVSRLAVVQAWPETDRAQVDGLVGLLSPRRTSYTLTMADGSLLRPVARSIQANPFAASVQTSTDIQQTDVFRADNFTIDASFIAAFRTSAVVERPAITGQASLFYEPPRPEEDTGRWTVRGSVRNDSPDTLNDAVILARGVSLRLESPLLPGDVQTFELSLPSTNQMAPAPAALERGADESSTSLIYSRFSRDFNALDQTVRDILGTEVYNSRAFASSIGRGAEAQENYRRQLFLSSFMQDYFMSSGRGNDVYLAGWSDAMPLNTELGGATWQPLDTALYLIELDVSFTPPAGRVHLGPEQFTWVARERQGLTTNAAPVNTLMQPGDLAIFQFTPLPDAVLSTVDTLHVELNIGTTSRLEFPLELWDWEAQEWRSIEMNELRDRSNVRRHTIRNPASFIGPQNAVQVRVNVDESSGLGRIAALVIEQEGTF